jgi:antitoxin component of MazEF toxin-antitoxin module
MSMPITIQVKLNRIGNSLKITVPIEVVRALKLKAGDTLEIGLTDSTMTVKKSP